MPENNKPSFQEWQTFLSEEMSVLDRLWEEDLDEVWTFVPSELASKIADVADRFYQAYWDLFRAVLESDKSWNEMKSDAKVAAAEARTIVGEAWLTVAEYNLLQAERQIEELRREYPQSPQLQLNKDFRGAKEAQARAVKAAGHATPRVDRIIGDSKKALLLINNCTDEAAEARRQAALQSGNESHHRQTIQLTKWRITIAVLSALVGLAGVVFSIYTFLSGGG